MPIDASVAQSPGWWMARLFKRLEEKRAGYDLLDSYYTGNAGIPVLASKAMRESYRRLMHLARTNYAELCVEAVRERMKVVGFRTGADGDTLGDKEAWRIWQANNLDADSALVDRASLSMGDAYVIVGDVDDDIGAPLITPEDPREVITAHDPRNRRRTVAGLKAFYDDEAGVDVAYVYVPGEVHRATREVPNRATGGGVVPMVAWGTGSGWEWDGDVELLPAPTVPVFRFPNRQTMDAGETRGEFEPHLALLDRINYTILTRLEIATIQAYRQRGLKGLPNTDDDGNEINYDDIFSADPGALWLLPAGADVWESGMVDLQPILSSIKADVQDFGAVTRTPLYYLTPDAANGSAEGASLTKEGLTFKAADRIVERSSPWEQVVAYAFLVMGDEERSRRADMEALWAPPERFSLAERYDAASKAIAAGVPWRTVMEDVLQFSPQQVDRMETDRASDALLSVPAAPDSAEAPAAGEGGPSEASDLKSRADAAGVLIRAGVKPGDALERAGLTGLELTGAVPTSLRPLDEDDGQ